MKKFKMVTKVNYVVEKEEFFEASSTEDVKGRVFRKIMAEMKAYDGKKEEFEIWGRFPFSEKDIVEHNGMCYVSASTCHVYITEDGELDYDNGHDINVMAKEIG